MLGHALHVRWHWLARVDPGRSWSTFSIKQSKIEQALLEASVMVAVGASDNTWFWHDRWLDGQSIASLAPELLLAVDRWAIKVCTVSQAMQHNRWVADITGSLSSLAIQQYLMMWERLEILHRDQAVPDKFYWKWSATR
jgi:hypothetical protein